MREKSWEDAGTASREAELYTTPKGMMYSGYSGVFNFKGFGRQIYSMPYTEALALHAILRKTGEKVTATQALKAFRPQLSLKEAMDIVTYIYENFVTI